MTKQNLFDSVLAMQNDPQQCKEYTEDNPAMIFRNGKWISIQEHNRQVKKGWNKTKPSKKISRQGQDKPVIYAETGHKHTCKIGRKNKACQRSVLRFVEK